MSSRVEIDREELEITAERTVRKNGNSLSVSLPPELLQGTGLAEDDDVRLVGDMEDGTIVVERIEGEDGESGGGDE